MPLCVPGTEKVSPDHVAKLLRGRYVIGIGFRLQGSGVCLLPASGEHGMGPTPNKLNIL